MPSCVLAYSGGLDTSVILGWLQDEGYSVHAVYVDLGQPCEDRDAILKTARDCGAAAARVGGAPGGWGVGLGIRHDGFAAGCAGQGRGSDRRLRARRAGVDRRQEEVGAGNG